MTNILGFLVGIVIVFGQSFAQTWWVWLLSIPAIVWILRAPRWPAIAGAVAFIVVPAMIDLLYGLSYPCQLMSCQSAWTGLGLFLWAAVMTIIGITVGLMRALGKRG